MREYLQLYDENFCLSNPVLLYAGSSDQNKVEGNKACYKEKISFETNSKYYRARNAKILSWISYLLERAISIWPLSFAKKCQFLLTILKHSFLYKINEAQHEISNNVVCAISNGSDQPAHMPTLIRAFACGLNIL